MARIILVNILRFIILVPLQVLILDNIHFFGAVNPYLYVLFILLLPFETPRWLLLILSFMIGLAVDIFSGTPGMHAASSVLMAYLRPVVIANIHSKKEFESGMQPGIKDLGIRWFFIYVLILVFVHHVSLFLIETFRFSGLIYTISRASFSTIFTVIIIIITQFIFTAPSKRR